MDNNLALLKNLHEDGSSILHYKSPREQELAEQIEQEIKEGERLIEQLFKVYEIQQEYHSRLIQIDKEANSQNNQPDLDAHQAKLRKQIENEYRSRLTEENAIAKKIQSQIYNRTDPLKARTLTAEIITESKRKIVENALRIICRNLDCQTAAIFLFSKTGRLERFGIRGWDQHHVEIDDNWFSDESYEVGTSFTGRAAQARAQGYGQIQVANTLGSEHLSPKSREHYENTFGKLNSAIAIPLNGRNKTYGVLRIINKTGIDQQGKKVVLNEPFTMEDVRLLLSLSNYVSTTLSNFRRDVQAHILKHLSHLLISNSSNSLASLQSVFQDIVDLLVRNPETAFQAAILRTKDENDAFKYEASSLFEGVTDDRDNCPKCSDEAYIWMVVAKGKRLIIQDLQESPLLVQFKNQKWARDNGFQAFGCFPLVHQGDVVGTLSVYLGRNYQFYPDAISFLQNIADMLALFLVKVKQIQEAERRFETLAREWKKETSRLPILLDRLINPNYQKIIGLGSAAIPSLLRELKQNPDHWFWALEAIVGESPIQEDHRGVIPKMIEDWLEWGKRQGYVFE